MYHAPQNALMRHLNQNYHSGFLKAPIHAFFIKQRDSCYIQCKDSE